jgi:hypothetical protein
MILGDLDDAGADQGRGVDRALADDLPADPPVAIRGPVVSIDMDGDPFIPAVKPQSGPEVSRWQVPRQAPCLRQSDLKTDPQHRCTGRAPPSDLIVLTSRVVTSALLLPLETYPLAQFLLLVGFTLRFTLGSYAERLGGSSPGIDRSEDAAAIPATGCVNLQELGSVRCQDPWDP